jgi:exodeoxyribonuclease VII small subunit
MANDKRKFEDDLKELETIVNRLDSGELPLEESIAAFERGVGLVKRLNQRLDEVEKKVEVLMRDAQGELRTTPLVAAPDAKQSTADDEEPVI